MLYIFYVAFYLINFSDLSSSVVYFNQLFVCWVIVYSDQLLGAHHTLIYLIRIICSSESFSPLNTVIVFVWWRNGANWTKAFFKGFLALEFNIVGGTALYSNNCLYNICKYNVFLSIVENILIFFWEFLTLVWYFLDSNLSLI